MKRVKHDCGKSHNTPEGKRRCSAKMIREADEKRMANQKTSGGYRRFRVLLNGTASVHGYIEVVAFDKEQAMSRAKMKTGDVSWTYDGVDDSSVEAVEALEE